MPYTTKDHVPYVTGDTSHDAARHQESTGRASTDRARIAAFLRSIHPAGTTTEEIEDALALSHQTASARVRDLVVTGDVVRTSERRRTRSGRNADVIVWRPRETP